MPQQLDDVVTGTAIRDRVIPTAAPTVEMTDDCERAVSEKCSQHKYGYTECVQVGQSERQKGMNEAKV